MRSCSWSKDQIDLLPEIFFLRFFFFCVVPISCFRYHSKWQTLLIWVIENVSLPTWHLYCFQFIRSDLSTTLNSVQIQLYRRVYLLSLCLRRGPFFYFSSFEFNLVYLFLFFLLWQLLIESIAWFNTHSNIRVFSANSTTYTTPSPSTLQLKPKQQQKSVDILALSSCTSERTMWTTWNEMSGRHFFSLPLSLSLFYACFMLGVFRMAL